MLKFPMAIRQKLSTPIPPRAELATEEETWGNTAHGPR